MICSNTPPLLGFLNVIVALRTFDRLKRRSKLPIEISDFSFSDTLRWWLSTQTVFRVQLQSSLEKSISYATLNLFYDAFVSSGIPLILHTKHGPPPNPGLRLNINVPHVLIYPPVKIDYWVQLIKPGLWAQSCTCILNGDTQLSIYIIGLMVSSDFIVVDFFSDSFRMIAQIDYDTWSQYLTSKINLSPS